MVSQICTRMSDPRVVSTAANARRIAKQRPSTSARRGRISVRVGFDNATRQYAIERCGIANPIDTRKIHYSCSKDARGVLSCGERKNTDDTFRGGVGDDDEEECRDTNDMCCGWAHDGECEKNPSFMLQSCPRSCDTCTVRCESRCCPPEKEAVKEETETQNDLNKPMNDGASTVRDDKVEDELHSFEDAREDEPLRAVEKALRRRRRRKWMVHVLARVSHQLDALVLCRSYSISAKTSRAPAFAPLCRRS